MGNRGLLTPVPQHPILPQRIDNLHHVPRRKRHPYKVARLVEPRAAGLGQDRRLAPQPPGGHVRGERDPLGVDDAKLLRVEALEAERLAGPSGVPADEIELATGYSVFFVLTTAALCSYCVEVWSNLRPLDWTVANHAVKAVLARSAKVEHDGALGWPFLGRVPDDR